ncbi:MAG: OsmC family protein [Bacteroidia bacterium]
MKRISSAIWNGTGLEGSGKLSSKSGVLKDTPYSFHSRFVSEDGTAGTNPEELIAAAHAGCFTMALSFQITAAGFTPGELTTDAIVILEKNAEGKNAIQRIDLIVKGKVEGLDSEKFVELATNAKQNCPVSVALSAVEITLSAELV